MVPLNRLFHSLVAPPLLSLGHHPRFHERSAKSGLLCEPPPASGKSSLPPSFTPNSPGNEAESSLEGQSAGFVKLATRSNHTNAFALISSSPMTFSMSKTALDLEARLMSAKRHDCL